MHLTKNMRIELSHQQSKTNFSQSLLDIGNGVANCNDKDEIEYDESIGQQITNVDELIQKIFPDVSINYKNSKWISERAILALRNDSVNTINEIILQAISSEEVFYESIDTTVNEDEATMYPTEFLNSLNHSGISQHILTLKMGCLIILMRNLNPPNLCNGTKLIVTKLMKYIIEAEIITGPGIL